MKKRITIIIATLLCTNYSIAQFICKISPKVNDVGDIISKQKGNSNDALMVGDFRKNGSGMVLLPNHTGAVFLENSQINQIIWLLDYVDGNLEMEVSFFKNGVINDTNLQIENTIRYIVNIKSKIEIELINSRTFQFTSLKKQQLISGKDFPLIKNKDNKTKDLDISFSEFSKKYIDSQMKIWQIKGEFEKTPDWKERVNNTTRQQKMDDLAEEAVSKYAESLNINFNLCYSNSSLVLGPYNADKEIFIVKSKNFGDLEIPVPISEAEKFKNKNWCDSDAGPSDVIYFILNNELHLAQATFVGIYKYQNPLAKNRKKTKKELDNDSNIQKELENKIYDYNDISIRPQFPGGIQKFYDFVGKNYRAPKEDIKGKIFVQFVVEKDGSLTDIKVMRDLGYGTGQEAVRVLSKCPKWIPGEVQGQKVKVLYSLPISVVGG